LRLVVLGRSPVTDPAVRAAVAELRAGRRSGAVRACDITDAGAVSSLVAALRAGATIAGLVHGPR